MSTPPYLQPNASQDSGFSSASDNSTSYRGPSSTQFLGIPLGSSKIGNLNFKRTSSMGSQSRSRRLSSAFSTEHNRPQRESQRNGSGNTFTNMAERLRNRSRNRDSPYGKPQTQSTTTNTEDQTIDHSKAVVKPEASPTSLNNLEDTNNLDDVTNCVYSPETSPSSHETQRPILQPLKIKSESGDSPAAESDRPPHEPASGTPTYPISISPSTCTPTSESDGSSELSSPHQSIKLDTAEIADSLPIYDAPPAQLGVLGAALLGGSAIALIPTQMQSALKWIEPELSPGIYQLINVEAGLAMDLSDSETTPVIGKPSYGGSTQRWVVERHGDAYSIQNHRLKSFLSVRGEAKDGINVTTSVPRMLWDIKSTGERDIFRICPQSSTLRVSMAEPHWFRSYTFGLLAEWEQDEFVQLLSKGSRQDWRFVHCGC